METFENSPETIDSLRAEIESAQTNLLNLLGEVKAAMYAKERETASSPDIDNQRELDAEAAEEAAHQQLAKIIELTKKLGRLEFLETQSRTEADNASAAQTNLNFNS